MSADNYYLITKHPVTGYAAVMGFMSDDGARSAQPDDRSFPTVIEAYRYAVGEGAEYGVSFAPGLLS